MYSALIKSYFKQQFQYRGSLYIQMIGSFLRVYIQVSIWTALLSVGASVSEDLKDLVTYTIISFLISVLTSSHVGTVLAQKVREGSIATDLIKPISLKWYLFFQQMSENVFNFIFIGIPVGVISTLLWGMKLMGIMEILLCICSLCFAVLLSFYFQYIMGLFVFWLKAATYTRMITSGLMTLFAGSMIPLWYYPAFLQPIVNVLPFRLMMFEPIAIFLGKYEIERVLGILFLQIIWILVFVVVEKIIWGKIQKNITVQGG